MLLAVGFVFAMRISRKPLPAHKIPTSVLFAGISRAHAHPTNHLPVCCRPIHRAHFRLPSRLCPCTWSRRSFRLVSINANRGAYAHYLQILLAFLPDSYIALQFSNIVLDGLIALGIYLLAWCITNKRAISLGARFLYALNPHANRRRDDPDS